MRIRSRLLAGILTMVLVPVLAEALISYIKNESYSLQRAAIVVVAVLALLAVIVLAGVVFRHLRPLLEAATVLAGVATTGLGLAVAVDARSADTEGSTIGLALVALGVLIAGGGLYLFYIDRTGVDLSFVTARKAESQSLREVDETGRALLQRTFPAFEETDREILELCRSEVDPEDLQYVAYYVHDEARFSLDVLDDKALNRFFRETGRPERRVLYERAAGQMHWLVDRFNIYLNRIESGILIRIVLDVERGALYYYLVDKNVYLVGVTLEQGEVDEADEKMARIVGEIGLLPRGGNRRSDR